jgi:hypothetical protein
VSLNVVNKIIVVTYCSKWNLFTFTYCSNWNPTNVRTLCYTVFTYWHMYICIYICIYVQVCVCVYTTNHICPCIYICIYMSTVYCIGLLPRIIHTGVTHIHIHIHIYIQTYIYLVSPVWPIIHNPVTPSVRHSKSQAWARFFIFCFLVFFPRVEHRHIYFILWMSFKCFNKQNKKRGHKHRVIRENGHNRYLCYCFT